MFLKRWFPNDQRQPHLRDSGQKNVLTCGSRSLCPSCGRKTDKPVLYVSIVHWLQATELKIAWVEDLYWSSTKTGMKGLNEMTNQDPVDRILLGLFYMRWVFLILFNVLVYHLNKKQRIGAAYMRWDYMYQSLPAIQRHSLSETCQKRLNPGLMIFAGTPPLLTSLSTVSFCLPRLRASGMQIIVQPGLQGSPPALKTILHNLTMTLQGFNITPPSSQWQQCFIK